MNLKNHFLVAMPTLNQTYFGQSVIYICEHSPEGAMGLIINQPIEDLSVQTVLSKLEITPASQCAELEQPVFCGGPVAEEQGFILHSAQHSFASSMQVADDLMITTSLDLLRAIGTDAQPANILLALGYAGWQSQQLEAEIKHNDWLVVEADSELIFEVPIEQRWHKAAEKLGINISTISAVSGQA